jgi:hypothetical protein
LGASDIFVFYATQVDLGGKAGALVCPDEFRREIEYMPSMASMLKVNGIPGRLGMLLRFETLETDFAALAVRLGIESGLNLPHRNKGYSPENWQHYYLISPDLVDLVAERFAEDIQMFGYDPA